MSSFLSAKLSKYIPATAAHACAEFILQHKVKVKLTNSRISKFGDFTPPVNSNPPVITINYDLNSYAFLLTLLHEFAHLLVFQKFKNNVAPHGNEWKEEFATLLKNFSCKTIFPEDVLTAIQKYLKDPKANGCTDEDLFRCLRKYDDVKNILLEQLHEGSRFELPGGKIFIKGKKLRKRFKCIEVTTNHVYYISGVAEVVEAEKEKVPDCAREPLLEK